MKKALKIIGVILLILVVIALSVYFLVLRYPKLGNNPKDGKWYRVTSSEMKDSEGITPSLRKVLKIKS